MELLEAVELYTVSLDILDAVPEVLAIGMASACFVVLAAGLLVGCFKALLRLIGR